MATRGHAGLVGQFDLAGAGSARAPRRAGRRPRGRAGRDRVRVARARACTARGPAVPAGRRRPCWRPAARRDPERRSSFGRSARRPRAPRRSVDDEHDHVGVGDGRLGLGHDPGGHALRPCSHPPVSTTQERPALPLGEVLGAVAGDAGLLLHDGDAAPEDAVDQRRLADVRAADDREGMVNPSGRASTTMPSAWPTRSIPSIRSDSLTRSSAASRTSRPPADRAPATARTGSSSIASTTSSPATSARPPATPPPVPASPLSQPMRPPRPGPRPVRRTRPAGCPGTRPRPGRAAPR
jgi:hypothetical protein